MFGSILLLAIINGVSAETVISGDGDITYNCPTIETIEVAYMDECPPTSVSGLSLTGVAVQQDYTQAPSSYQASPYSLILTCRYGDSSTSLECLWLAGGGDSPTDTGNDADCPDLSSQAAPQPSPGVDYRRRRALRKRFDQSTQFDCPWTSDNSDFYVMTASISNGELASSGEYTYYCYIHTDTGSRLTCQYDQVSGALTETTGNDACPQSLCTAGSSSSTSSRKRSFDPRRAIIASRQVNATELRNKLQSSGTKTTRSNRMKRLL